MRCFINSFAVAIGKNSRLACLSKWVLAGLGYLLLCIPTNDLMAEDPVTREQIRELIQELGQRSNSARTRAERKILDLGPEVLPLLPVLDTVESDSTRESLRRIRIQLERRAAKDSSGPSRILLKGEFTLGEILTQIQQQTRNRITIAAEQSELCDRKMTVDWDHATFWDCVDQLCQSGPFEHQFSADSASILLSASTTNTPVRRHVQRAGPFRLAIDTVELKEIVGEPQKKLVRVVGRIAAEPRLRPLSLTVAAANLNATTNTNQMLTPWNPDAKYEYPVRDGSHEVQIHWDFIVIDVAELKSLSIQGQIICQIAAATERVVFDRVSLTKGTIRRRGGVSIRLREVNFTPVENGEMDAEIGIAVSYDAGGPAFESHKTWIFHNAVYLETRSGTRTSFMDFDTTQESAGVISVDYRWRSVAAPMEQYLFVYEAPTLILDVPLVIDLGQIPIRE